MEEPQPADMVQDAPEAQTTAPAESNPALDKYNEDWKAVQENPNDFNAWTTLIASAEKLDDLERIKAVYEPFLASFPLCYGYWKKYAEAEARHQNVATALSIYERGTAATPYSMDLWGAYASCKKANDGTAEEVRSIFERALAYNGSDYLSHSLWDKYMSFEEEQGSSVTVAALYTRILSQPLKQLDRYMQSLQSFTQGRSASELVAPEAADALMGALAAQKQAAAAAAEGESAMADTSVSDEEVKAAWLAQQEAACKASKDALSAVRSFEDAIRRPYFHPKPLDAPQLLNWARYLDWAEAQGPEHVGTATRVYERCMVACAAYPEFWERYIRWLEAGARVAEADNALVRAANVFCKARPEMHLFAARYDERYGRLDEARARYAHVLDELSPNLLQAVVAAANFERRQGRTDVACSRWEGLLASERGKEEGRGSKVYPFVAMQYASFLRQVARDVGRARAVLEEALSLAPHIRQLWEAAIHFEETVSDPDAAARIMSLYDRAVVPTVEGQAKGLSEKDREEMSLRRVEFADQCGDAEQLSRAEREHAAHFMLPTSIAAAAAASAASADNARKRANEGAGAEGADGQAAKVAKTDADAAAAAAATPAAPGTAAAGAAGATAADAAAHAAYYQQYGQYPASYGHYPGYGAYPGYGYPGY